MPHRSRPPTAATPKRRGGTSGKTSDRATAAAIGSNAERLSACPGGATPALAGRGGCDWTVIAAPRFGQFRAISLLTLPMTCTKRDDESPSASLGRPPHVVPLGAWQAPHAARTDAAMCGARGNRPAGA